MLSLTQKQLLKPPRGVLVFHESANKEYILFLTEA